MHFQWLFDKLAEVMPDGVNQEAQTVLDTIQWISEIIGEDQYYNMETGNVRSIIQDQYYDTETGIRPIISDEDSQLECLFYGMNLEFDWSYLLGDGNPQAADNQLVQWRTYTKSALLPSSSTSSPIDLSLLSTYLEYCNLQSEDYQLAQWRTNTNPALVPRSCTSSPIDLCLLNAYLSALNLLTAA